MKTNIALIGFMGTGKTAVGEVLAEKLGKKLVELDFLIEQKAGKPIPVIFQQDGEIAFRELEIEVAGEVSAGTNLVIACGGLSIPKMCASPLGYKIAEQFGLKLWPTAAGLVPFTLQPHDKDKLEPLSGISVESNVICSF